MAGELRALGVRRVRAILVDQSLFDERYVPPAFEQQPEEWAPFRAPVAAVSLNENTVLFTVRALKEGGDAVVEVDPPGFVDVLGGVATTHPGDPEKVSVVLEPRGARLAGRLSGNLPEGGRLVRVARRVDDPRLLAGYALRAVLRQVGVEVRGEVRLGGAGQNGLLVSHHSQSVGALLWALGKDSDNFYAEMLFKAIGAKAGGRPASADAGAEAVRRAIEDAGVGDPALVVKNGSGLFDADRTTPAATTALLRAMYRDASVGPEYLAHLSIGGVDGTLRHRFREWEGTRAVRAKTGTLDAVAALSGYVLPPAGRGAVAFSVLVNGIPGKVTPARALMDRLVDAIAREVWKGLVVP
jgi:D-alanyl-D-alanine carboxypeptidase/D-alanyl-D-alanine-endopeptidase (penicillin-binding protein 4)